MHFLYKGDVNNIEEKYYKVWLTLIKNLGIKRYSSLIDKFKNRKNIYHAKENQLYECQGIGENLAKQLLDENIKINAKRHLQFLNKNNIDKLPTTLPNIILFNLVFLLSILSTPNSNKKSKKKLINNTTSRYIFIINLLNFFPFPKYLYNIT